MTQSEVKKEIKRTKDLLNNPYANTRIKREAKEAQEKLILEVFNDPKNRNLIIENASKLFPLFVANELYGK